MAKKTKTYTVDALATFTRRAYNNAVRNHDGSDVETPVTAAVIETAPEPATQPTVLAELQGVAPSGQGDKGAKTEALAVTGVESTTGPEGSKSGYTKASNRRRPQKDADEKREIVSVEVAPELLMAAKISALERGQKLSPLVEERLRQICKDLAGIPPEEVRQSIEDIYPVTRTPGTRTSLWLPKTVIQDARCLAIRAKMSLKNLVNAAFAQVINQQ